MSRLELSATRKFRWRILTPIVLLIALSSLDRVNISFAALQMNAAIGLSPETYGFAVSAFFVGYLLLQFPSTLLLTRIGARRWIAACVISWGAVALSMAFVQSASQLYVLRFLLGCAESGFAPGIVYYTSQWMPARHRANTIAVTMVAIPISVIVGGPLCGWLMSVMNPFALPGWRWMLLIEGAGTVLMGCVAYALVVDKPADACWLTNDEKNWIAGELSREQRVVPAETIWGVLRQSRLWLAAGVWAATLIGANGLVFWLPQVLKEISNASDFVVGVLAALPWAGVALGMIFNSRHSDQTQERFWHVGVAFLVAATALCVAAMSRQGTIAMLFLFIAGVGLGSAQGVFWAIPVSFLQRSAAAQGITLINLVGNVGSLVGPYAIGVIRARQESIVAPVWFVAAVLALGLLLLATLGGRRDALA